MRRIIRRGELWLVVGGAIFLTLGIVYYHLLPGVERATPTGQVLLVSVKAGDDRLSVYSDDPSNDGRCTVVDFGGGEKATLRSDSFARDLPGGWYARGELTTEGDLMVTCASVLGGSFGIGPTYSTGTVFTQWLLLLVGVGLVATAVVLAISRRSPRNPRPSW